MSFITNYQKIRWQRAAVQILGAQSPSSREQIEDAFNALRKRAAPTRIIQLLQLELKKVPAVFSKRTEKERVEFVFQQVEKRI